MKFVFASDSFKETLNSQEIAHILEREAHRYFPQAVCKKVSIADGGEYSSQALFEACGGTWHTCTASDPLGRSLQVSYLELPQKCAVVECAAACGLTHVSADERNPCNTTSYGVGEIILDALDKGIRTFILALGGTATNDAGMGCARALGVRFFDYAHNELLGCGSDLARVAEMDISFLDERIKQSSFHLMSDVDCPLLGIHGAAHMFAPQKGADEPMVAFLEQSMASFAEILSQVSGIEVAQLPGAGAAGGIGAMAYALFHAQYTSGIDYMLDLIHFDEMLVDADICITGEGHADAQSLRGKAISGIAARCKKHGVFCLALTGGLSRDVYTCEDNTIDAWVPCVLDARSLSDELYHAEENVTFAARRIFQLLAQGYAWGRKE